MKRTPLKRGSSSLRRTPIKKGKNSRVKRAVWWLKDLFGYRDAVRREDEIAAREKVFGAKADFVRRQKCVLDPNRRSHWVNADSRKCRYAWRTGVGFQADPAHVVHSQGAGGDSTHLIPLCRKHHTEQHNTGVETFAAKHGLDLEKLAAEYELRWQALNSNGEQK